MAGVAVGFGVVRGIGFGVVRGVVDQDVTFLLVLLWGRRKSTVPARH